ncbi:hypothetical protein C3L33_11996, partial [Rhododendron williamsianum]
MARPHGPPRLALLLLLLPTRQRPQPARAPRPPPRQLPPPPLPPPSSSSSSLDSLPPSLLRRFRRHLLKNYTLWCSFLGQKSNLRLTNDPTNPNPNRRELLYVSLYLLIWGESANLRFLPECICYIFHHMAMDLNKILDGYIDENTGRPFVPHLSGENAFLNRVVRPIYETVRAEVENSRNGTAPHSAWRNYDDVNEYFWSRRCFEKLKWPIDLSSNFFVTSNGKGEGGGKRVVGKTGFVEQRSFWNLFRSFDKLWIALILFFQAAFIVAWEERDYPWRRWRVGTFRETLWLGVRMVLKSVVAAAGFWFSGFSTVGASVTGSFCFTLDSEFPGEHELEDLLLVVLVVSEQNICGSWPERRSGGQYEVYFVLACGACYKILLHLLLTDQTHDCWAIVAPSGLDLPMDLQIWYSIYSSFVGAAVGLFAHLGEIRNLQQLRLRFQFFASAMQFNLMPEEQLLNTKGTLKSKIKDVIHRLKLRYGFGRPFKKLESNQAEANKFALIWNEIITTFREEDIVSDQEVELLELPENSWNVRVIRWPCLLLCNELLLALSQAKELVDAPDKWLWYKICKNEYRRCAVIESYDSVRHLLLAIVKCDTEEHSIITLLFQEIDQSIQIEKFTKTYNMTALPQIHSKLITLLELLIKPKKDIHRAVNVLQALYEIVIRDFYKVKRSTDQLREDGLASHRPASSHGLLFENSIELPASETETFYRQARRLHTILTSRDAMNNIPANLEARRRIAFFSNSLFMNMPHAPQVEKMMAFSVLTPYYNEEVMYSKEQLRTENEDGISTLYYLQTIYADEWKNFIERMQEKEWQMIGSYGQAS